jgi:hypothetical protein
MLGGLLAAAAPLHAALWGYVDGDGIAHFADHAVDSRYGLVLAEKGSPTGAIDKVPGKKSGPSSILTWLEIAPEVKRVRPWVREAASRHGVDAELIIALIAVESGFNDKALSPKGAVGLMQVMPSTAQRFMPRGVAPAKIAERLAEPRTNITVGTRLMADLLKRHRRIDLAIASVERWRRRGATQRRRDAGDRRNARACAPGARAVLGAAAAPPFARRAGDEAARGTMTARAPT